MQTRYKWMWLVPLLLGVQLVACGPRQGATQPLPSQDLVVSMPSLVVDIQKDGQIVIDEAPITDLAAAFDQEIALGPLDPAVVDLLIRSNIQHVQIDNAPSGPLFLINGEPIPSINWDESSLALLGLVLELFSEEQSGLSALLPLVRHLGVGATVRLPIGPEVSPIPLAVTGDDSAAGRALASQEEWLDVLDGEPLGFRLEVNYSADGRASLVGPGEGFLSTIGIPLRGLNQPLDTMQVIHELGIESIALSSDRNGIRLSINEQTMPSIAWTEGELSHLLTIALQLGLQEPADTFDPRIVRVLDFIERWLPLVQTTELQLAITFV